MSDGEKKYRVGAGGVRNAITPVKEDEFGSLVSEAGFQSGAEGIFAPYRAGKDEAVLLLLEYPTPQLAEQHLRHLEQAISPAAKQARTTVERKGSLLSLILKPSSVSYGDSLRSALNYETHVTWHEPTQTITDPPWLTIVGKIFISTGLLIVVAVVLGV